MSDLAERLWVVVCNECYREEQVSGEMAMGEAVEIFKSRGWTHDKYMVWTCGICAGPPKSWIKHEPESTG